MGRALGFDWHSDDNHLILNPRLPQTDAARAQRAWAKWSPSVKGHVGLLTSGSTSGGGRLILLSKTALLTSAAAVNEHLHATSDDVWLKTLPDFHVGGLGIYVRAMLNNAHVENEMGVLGSWNLQRFAELLAQTQATLISLVPSQVFDLVAHQLEAPKSLRAIIVGGGALSHEVFVAATKLGWPVLPSYGLTECCSQVGTASIADWQDRAQTASPDLSPLPIYLLSHVKVEGGETAPLKIQSPSLLTARITLTDGDGEFEDPKVNGWFQTEDYAQVIMVNAKPALQVAGRGGDFIKIGGEGVNIASLEAKLQKLRIDQSYHWDLALVAVEDARLGHVIHLLTVASPQDKRQALIDAFAEQVLPFERIRKVTEVERIPRSALGKLLQGEAKRLAAGRSGLS